MGHTRQQLLNVSHLAVFGFWSAHSIVDSQKEMFHAQVFKFQHVIDGSPPVLIVQHLYELSLWHCRCGGPAALSCCLQCSSAQRLTEL